jgi:hypothetical protein
MKTLLAAGALALSPAFLLLAPRPSAAPHPALADETPLGQAMEALKANLKVLARSVEEPAREAEALEALGAMQAAVLGAKVLDPQNLPQVPEAERDAHRRAFRKEMLALLQERARLEQMLLDGERAGVVREIKGPLMDRRNAAHERFQTKE